MCILHTRIIEYGDTEVNSNMGNIKYQIVGDTYLRLIECVYDSGCVIKIHKLKDIEAVINDIKYINNKYKYNIDIKDFYKETIFNRQYNKYIRDLSKVKYSGEEYKVLGLFGNLCYDIQLKIFDEVVIIKQTEKNKSLFNIVLDELTDFVDNHMENSMVDSMVEYKILKSVYKDFEIGLRVVKEYENYNETDIIYDEIYYKDLDFILDTKKNTTININTNDINHKYHIKENLLYKYVKNYVLHTDIDTYEYDDCWEVVKARHYTYGFDLWDWLEMSLESCDIIQKNTNYYYRTLVEILSSDYMFINRDSDTLKEILIKNTLNGFTIFNDKLDYEF